MNKKSQKLVALHIILIIFTASVPIYYFIVLNIDKDKEIPPTDTALDLTFDFEYLNPSMGGIGGAYFMYLGFVFEIWTNETGTWELYESCMVTEGNGYSTTIKPNEYYEVRYLSAGIECVSQQITNPIGTQLILIPATSITAHFAYSGGLGDAEGLDVMLQIYGTTEIWVDMWSLTTDEFGMVIFDGLLFSHAINGVYEYRLVYDGITSDVISRTQQTTDDQLEFVVAATVGFVFVESIRDTLIFIKIIKEND